MSMIRPSISIIILIMPMSDVITLTWLCFFLCYWSFVSIPSHKGPALRSFDIYVLLRCTSCWTNGRVACHIGDAMTLMWRHCYDCKMYRCREKVLYDDIDLSFQINACYFILFHFFENDNKQCGGWGIAPLHRLTRPLKCIMSYVFYITYVCVRMYVYVWYTCI